MSCVCEITTPKFLLLLAAPIRVEEEIAVATLHERESKTRQADGVIAQVVGFPAALREPITSKQDGSDISVGDVLKPRVERAQREDKTLSSIGR